MLSGGAGAAHLGGSPLPAALGGRDRGMKEWRKGKGGKEERRRRERERKEERSEGGEVI